MCEVRLSPGPRPGNRLSEGSTSREAGTTGVQDHCMHTRQVAANICLHHLLDGWFAAEFAHLGEFVRYADDAVFVFTDEAVAQRFQAALQTRLQEAGLSLNIAKSAIVPFSSSAPKGVVSFLGFDLYWGKDRVGGRLLKLKTAAKRLHRSMQAFTDWVKDARNSKPLKTLWADAAARLSGHSSYSSGSVRSLSPSIGGLRLT